MAFDELAQRLFGARRAESDAILTDATTGTIHGVALTDSEGGAVTVEITADVTAPEPLEVGDETYFADAGVGVEIPTSESVRAGDEVLVSTYGAGTMRSPVVTAAVGSGDRMAAAVQDAHDLAASVEGIAQEAKEVAEATGQHFWPDDDGVHVTEVTQDEWNDSTGSSYHSGANVLLNALGQLFRDGLNNLLAIVAGRAYSDTFEVVDVYAEGLTCDLTAWPLGGREGLTVTSSAGDLTGTDWNYDSRTNQVIVSDNYTSHHLHAVITVAYRSTPGTAIYDGQGNAASNILAEFTSNLVRIGGRLAAVGESTAKVQFFESTSDTALTATHYVYDTSQGQDPTVSDNVALGTTVNDTALATGEGRSARSYLNLYGSLYNDGSSYSDAAEASIVVGNISPTDGRMANKTAIWARTLDYSGATKREIGLSAGRLVLSTESYTTGDEVGTNLPMEQAIAALTTPLYSNSSNVAITTANTDITGPSVTVPAGAYIIVVAYTFPTASGSGTRVTTLGYKPGSGSAQYNTFVQGSRAAARLSMFNIVHITAQTSFTAYVRSDQTISSASGLYIGMTRIS